MYNVDWDLLVSNLLPWYKRKQKVKDYLHVLIQPLKQLHSQFITYRDDTLYSLAITSQVIYLEKYLNDKFNAGQPARGASVTVGLYNGVPSGIYISSPSNAIYPVYLWNKAEERPRVYLYNKWSRYVTYSVGEFAVYGNSVWKALATTTDEEPDVTPLKWQFHKDRLYLYNKSELGAQYDFIVNIPTAVGLVSNADFAAKVTAALNVYVIAGLRFQLVNY